MAVYCQVLHDGQPTGPEYPLPHGGQVTDAGLLAVKERSAREKGWATEWEAAGLHCWKTYPANTGIEGEPSRVDRFFEIRPG